MSKLTPHEHFSVVYNAKVELTNEVQYKPTPLNVFWQPIQNTQIHYETEKIVSIKMSESNYKKFLTNHMRIVELMEGVVHDQRIRDQFEKLMILINLTK